MKNFGLDIVMWLLVDILLVVMPVLLLMVFAI